MAYAALSTIQTIATGQPFLAATLQQANDNGEFLINPPTCSVKESTAQSVADNTVTAMTADEENFDNDSMHSTVSNTSRITIQTAGRYLVTATVQYAADADGYRVHAFRVNGTTTYDMQVNPAAGSAAQTTMSGTRSFVFAASDYIEVLAFHLAGANLNVTLLDFTAVFLTR